MRHRDFWQRVRDKADFLGTDGCTGVGPLFRDCCRLHDVMYRTHRSMSGRYITRGEADRRFLCCMQNRSWFGWWSPVARLRYWAVRWFGQSSWDKWGR